MHFDLYDKFTLVKKYYINIFIKINLAKKSGIVYKLQKIRYYHFFY